MADERLCYIDIHGVLADFLSPALALHNRSVPEVYAATGAPGTWATWDVMGIDADSFWAPIHRAGFSFWDSLRWTLEGPYLLRAAEMAFGEKNVRLLSAPGEHPSAWSGTRSWVQRELPRYANRMHLTTNKAEFALHRRVLVDDSDLNLTGWAEAGGTGVHVPRLWNREHRDSTRVVRSVFARLEQITNIRFVVFPADPASDYAPVGGMRP